MNPSAILKRFLHSGKQPTSQRESAALLDESRGLLLSKLPTTGETIQNFTTDELASVNLKGGNVLDAMHKVYLEKQSFKPSNTPSTMQVFTSPTRSKPSAPPTAKPAATAPRPAPAASKPTVIHRATASTTKPAAAPEAPSANLTTASQYATKPLVMKMDEFNKLTPSDRMRYVKNGGKLA